LYIYQHARENNDQNDPFLLLLFTFNQTIGQTHYLLVLEKTCLTCTSFTCFASSIYVTLKLANCYFYMHQMRNTPFIIDFKTSCVDCAERLVTIALMNATNVYCIADPYT
jgi:hypothetical protein